ncbi:MAG TPA: tetratricopeptide repeat protein [Drouetiella sp.]
MTRAGILRTSLLGACTVLMNTAPAAFSQQNNMFELMPAGSSHTRSAFERGVDEMAHRDYEGAANAFTEAIGFNMNNSDAYFKRGQCYYYQKNYAGAISDFDYMLKMKPGDAQALLWLGTAHARQGNEQRAVDYYLQAMRNDPQLVSAFQQGNGQSVHSVNPRNEGAVNAYEKAVQLYLAEKGNSGAIGSQPAIPESTLNAAGKKSSIAPAGIEKDTTMNEPEMRIEQLDQAIASDPSNAVLRFRRGQVNKRLGNAERALSDFSDAINLDPMKSRFYLARARLYHEQNQPDLAQADVRKAQSVDPTVPRHFKFQ